MATISWRRNKQVTIYYWDSNLGKTVALPRKETKHLDGKPKDYVLKWKEDWERSHGKGRARVERIHLKDQDLLAGLWRQYQTHTTKTTHRRQSTENEETDRFHRWVCAFFVKQHHKKEPVDWHPLIPAFHTYLYEKKLSDSTVRKILWSIERFGKFLMWIQYMAFPFVVIVPKTENKKETPLQARREPDEIISFIKNAKYEGTDINYNLAILLGYFAALGPGELFALEKADLLTGPFAERLSKTLPGFRKYGLGSKLAVCVNKTLPPKGKRNAPVPYTKNSYRTGVINIWNADAARYIAAMMKDKSEGRLFPYSYSHLTRFWREKVRTQLDVTPHDLRRASCLYLGRTVRIEPTLLQEHMRHAEIETTMLYCREPSTPELPNNAKQDFDDIG